MYKTFNFLVKPTLPFFGATFYRRWATFYKLWATFYSKLTGHSEEVTNCVLKIYPDSRGIEPR